MTRKTYTGYLIVNYRDDELRFRKTKPSKGERSPSEYPVKVEVAAEVPDFDIPTLAAEFSVPEAQIKRAAHDDLIAEGAVPEYEELAAEAVERHDDLVAKASGNPQGVEFDDAVSVLVGYILRRAEGYPDPAAVEEHVERRLHERVGVAA